MSQPRSLRRAVVWVYFGYVFRYLSLLILVPLYGRVLGAAEYGRVLAAMSLYQTVWVLGEFGFAMVGARETAAARERSTLGKIYGRQLSARLLMFLPGVALGLVAVFVSPTMRDQPLVGLLGAGTGLFSAFNMGWFFQGTFRHRTSVMLELMHFALTLLVAVSFVRTDHDGWIVMASQMGSSLLVGTTAHVVSLRIVGLRNVRMGGGLSLIRESFALFAHKGLAMIMASSSTYVIGFFGTALEVGWYGAAERMATVGLSLIQPIGQVLVSEVSIRFGDTATHAAAYSLARKGLLISGAVGICLFAGSLITAPFAMPLIFGPGFEPAVRILQILAWMFPFAALSQALISYVLVPLRFDKYVSIISLISATLTLILMLTLGRLWAGPGIGIARAIVQAVSTVIILVFVRQRHLLSRILDGR